METRLRILFENDVIDQEVFDYSNLVYSDILVPRLNDGSNAEVLMTHLAMATQRIKQGNIAGSMESFILDEIKGLDTFEAVKELAEAMLSSSPVSFPESEQEFIWLHLSNVLTEDGGES